jgi:putative transposase
MAFGFKDSAAGRRRWVERLDDQARSEAIEKCGVAARDENHDVRRSDLRRGWYWGSQAFAEQMLKIEAALRKPRSRGGPIRIHTSMNVPPAASLEAIRGW